ncbi:sugar porter family MFS transporter [Streptomyces sp. NPDC055092]
MTNDNDVVAPSVAGTAAAPPRSAAIRNRYLTRLTVIATLGGLLFGYDTGVISGALLYLRADLQLSTLGEGVVVSALLFGAMLGALVGGRTGDALGRKGTIQLCGLLFLAGTLGSALAPSAAFLATARVVLGLAVGGASVTVPLYLAEMAPADRRGRMVTIDQLMISIGALLAFVVNSVIDQLIGGAHVWRWMLGVAAVPAVVLLVGMLFLPDSPRWYALKGRFADTRRVLELSRSRDEAAAEYASILRHADDRARRDRSTALRTLGRHPWMRRLLYIGIGLAVIQQATGVNTLVYYGTTILASTGLGTSASIFATVGLGVGQVVGVIVGIILLGRFGRRSLLTIGLLGITASLALLAVCFLLPASTAVSYLILATMVVFSLCMGSFAGPLIWLVLSEIFPMAIRGFAMGIAVCALWVANTIISFVFPMLTEAVGAASTFGVFVLVNALSTIFVVRYMPETKGRTLEQLEDGFRAAAGADLATS